MDNKELTDLDSRYLDSEMLVKMIRGGAANLRNNAREVNDLNVFPVPDGDTGDNMSMTMEGGVAALDGMESASLTDVVEKLSHGMLLGARGNSGVILSQFFAGMNSILSKSEKADVHAVCEALNSGVKQAYASVITPTEGTILTVAREAVEYATSQLNDESTLGTLFADLLDEMYNSLQRTPEILAVLSEAGVVDSGGAGLYYIAQGFYKTLQGEELELPELESSPAAAPAIDLSVFGPDDEMTYGYCTELLLQLQNKKVNPDTFEVSVITDYLKQIGNSIAAFKTGSTVKIHVHTKTPELALKFCREFGEFLTVKIENMSVQHNNKKTEHEPEAKNIRPAKDYGTVAVASGDGIAETFTQLGVDHIVPGGQTQNPSAQDFVAAFEAVGAKNIYVFPNNGNIVMAAKQAAQLYDGGNVFVIESKDLGQGYAAISSLNFECDDPEQIARSLNEAMTHVKTGLISPSIRDCELNGVQIKTGDYIGFVAKEMVVSCKEMTDSCKGLIDHMMEICDDVYMITAFVGKDATDDITAEIEAYINEKYPDVDFYPTHGGQDVYPFIFVVE